MSAERLSLGLNSLIPEAYRSKAEALAKCLQHKLLSLGRTEALNGGRRRVSEGEGESGSGSGSGGAVGRPGDSAGEKKTEDSEEEFCSHSESENEPVRRKQKLTSMSSEDSTVESWGSCQENLTDLEKVDSETEEVGSLAAQVKGSPKLRSLNIRAKRKEVREKASKKHSPSGNPRRKHSSSAESVDAGGARQGRGREADDFDRELSCQYILLDGLEPEDEDVPHRILRESSSTSSLERHFFRREKSKNCFEVERRAREEEDRVGSELLTPPPSPDLERKPPLREEGKGENFTARIQFAAIETDSETPFAEAEVLETASVGELCRPVKKLGGVVVECECDDSSVPECSTESAVVTSVEVLQDTPTDGVQEAREDIETPEDDDILNCRSRMRRCSSLKTWKTPPGTPGAKKIVRFADALGLDLADVRTFLDEIPKVPNSAFDDLHFDLPKPEHLLPPPPTTLLPLFRPPATQFDFLHKLQAQNICLESTALTLDGVPTITAFVRVRNLHFHKSVHVRYTLNNWHTFADLQATYVPNSCDGFSDSFSFVLYGHTLKVGEKLEFALRLDCCGEQYWDNNGGANYAFHCLPQTPATPPDPWLDFY